MEAKMKSSSDVMIIQVQGTLDIEHTQGFKKLVLKNFVNEKLVFNLHGAAFVGSTGLSPFLETIQALSQASAHGVRVVGLSSEFQRLFQNLELNNLQVFENEESAIKSFQPFEMVG